MLQQTFAKFILDLTDKEVLEEVSAYLGKSVVMPTDKLGWLTENTQLFTKDGMVIHEPALQKLYDSEPYISEYLVVSSITSLRRRPSDLFSLLRKQKPGNKVLEFGCGSSTHGVACAQRGCEVTVVDISSRMLAWATSRYTNRGLKVNIHPPTEALPVNYFDTVICSDVMEHIPDPDAVLTRFIKAMKLGATVHLHVAMVPNLVKGHLPIAIKKWRDVCMPRLKRLFKQESKHNFTLMKNG